MTLLEKNRIWGKKYRSKPGYREYNRIRMSEWRKKNPERWKELSRQHYQRNRENILKYLRSYYRANRNKFLENCKLAYAKNREAKKEYNRKYRAERKNDPEFLKKIRASSRASYQKHKEKISAVHRNWRIKNPGKWRSLKMRRRALERGTAINPEKINDWMSEVLSRDSFICTYCKREFSTKFLHFDHIVPLSRGGCHSLENLCVSCPSCNLSKGSKLYHEWISQN